MLVCYFLQKGMTLGISQSSALASATRYKMRASYMDDEELSIDTCSTRQPVPLEVDESKVTTCMYATHIYCFVRLLQVNYTMLHLLSHVLPPYHLIALNIK